MTQADEFRQFIELQVVRILQKLAQEGQLTEAQMTEIAGLTLDLIKPGMNIEQLYSNAVKLDDKHPQLAPVVHVLMEAYEKHYEHRVIDQVSNLIKSGKYDDAQHMVKKVLEYKISQ